MAMQRAGVWFAEKAGAQECEVSHGRLDKYVDMFIVRSDDEVRVACRKWDRQCIMAIVVWHLG